MRVTEIFHSIQGESTHAGRPCVFVRFTGCDLRCGYCDTAYAFHGGKTMSREEILAEVERVSGTMPVRFVCLTGGEPMLQPDLPDLAKEILDRGWDVSIETHGQRPLDRLPDGVFRIVDLKTPGSGEEHRDFSVFKSLGPLDEIKVVVTNEADFKWAANHVRELGLDRKTRAVLFSPAQGMVEPSALADWLLASGLNARLQVQLHKVVWGPNCPGK